MIAYLIQHVALSRNVLLAKRCTKRVVNTAKTAERRIVAKQLHDTRMLLQRRGDHYEQLPACSQPRQASFEVWTERVQLQPRQKSVLKRRLAEAAQQRTPMVVRTERMIGNGSSSYSHPSASSRSNRAIASSAHAQCRNRQARRSIDASFNDPFTDASTAMPLPTSLSVSSFSGVVAERSSADPLGADSAHAQFAFSAATGQGGSRQRRPRNTDPTRTHVRVMDLMGTLLFYRRSPTYNSLVTSKTPVTSRARTSAICRSAALSTTPSSIVRPPFTMMWIG